jgi:hypothetical protein
MKYGQRIELRARKVMEEVGRSADEVSKYASAQNVNS